MVDDLLATGGTIEATVKLIRRLVVKWLTLRSLSTCSISAVNSVSKNRALPATALSRSGPLIIVSLALLTLRAAQDCAFSLAVLTGLC